MNCRQDSRQCTPGVFVLCTISTVSISWHRRSISVWYDRTTHSTKLDRKNHTRTYNTVLLEVTSTLFWYGGARGVALVHGWPCACTDAFIPGRSGVASVCSPTNRPTGRPKKDRIVLRLLHYCTVVLLLHHHINYCAIRTSQIWGPAECALPKYDSHNYN